MQKKYDVLGIGNAIVDILVKVEYPFLEKHKLIKNSMNLINEDKALELYEDMPKGKKVSGGSAANTIAGIASFGGKTAYISKVRDDQLGKFFSDDMAKAGINFLSAHSNNGARTAFSLIFITPDAQRTMATYLGATREMTKDDIDEKAILHSDIIYLEGYLWDEDNAIEGILKAVYLAHKHNKKVAFTLSDLFCVDRHRDAFLELIASGVDILFANEEEIKRLYQIEDISKIINKVKYDCDIVAITRGKNGSIIATQEQTYTIKAEPITKLVDTTGAGDLYAAGFLYGLSLGLKLEQCGRYGSIAAAEIIQHIGARPEHQLAQLVA